MDRFDRADRCSSSVLVFSKCLMAQLEVGNKHKASLSILKRAGQAGTHLGVRQSLWEAGVGELLLGLCLSGRLKLIIGSMQSLQQRGA